MCLTKPMRAEEYSREASDCGIIFLLGTMRRDDGDGLRTLVHEFHGEYSFGWTLARHSNKSCGVSIMVNKLAIKESNIVQSFVPPKQLRGRVGAIRIKTGTSDVTACTTYFPPPPRGAAHARGHRGAVDALAAWMHGLASSLAGS